ncbi:hypothetical protein ACTXT7_016881 [Hymenolepis weldensis]
MEIGVEKLWLYLLDDCFCLPTKFDTELFQIDTQELSQELPEHADVTIPVQDYFHDFLPEHDTASPKTRDKPKRKTPKSTAVKQRPNQSSNTEASNTNFCNGGSLERGDDEVQSYKNDPRQHANLFTTCTAIY